jgi:hypothetical protein
MPERIIEQTFPDGITRKIKEMDFTVDREEWNEYTLSDGTTVRIKAVVGKIFRVLDDQENPAYTANNDPFIIVRSANQVFASE